jgi:hypothetical protein
VDALGFFLFQPDCGEQGVELLPKLSSPKLRWSQTERRTLCCREGIDDVEFQVKLLGRHLRPSLG